MSVKEKIPAGETVLTCPLCLSENVRHICHDTIRFESERDYYRCIECDLIFVPPDQLLTPVEEKVRYDQHENDPDDPRYLAFLSQLANPMLESIPPQSTGLDFGSGPGPAMQKLFGPFGHSVRLYDPLYNRDPSVFLQTFDFIITSETMEHVSNPRRELLRCWNCLKEGGIFGMMTLRHSPAIDFQNWHYRMDDTHVCFYSDITVQYITTLLHARASFLSERVVLLHKEFGQKNNYKRSPVR